MKTGRNGLAYFILSSATAFFCFNHTLEACGERTNRYSVESDGYGNQVVLWKDGADNSKPVKAAIISSEGVISSPVTIPLTGIHSTNTIIKTTSNGDIIAFWLSPEEGKKTYSLFTSTLPYQGNWTKPIRLSNDEEGVLPKGVTVIISETNKATSVNVYFESQTFFNSRHYPYNLTYKEELRLITGTLRNGWAQVSTLSTIGGTKE